MHRSFLEPIGFLSRPPTLPTVSHISVKELYAGFQTISEFLPQVRGCPGPFVWLMDNKATVLKLSDPKSVPAEYVSHSTRASRVESHGRLPHPQENVVADFLSRIKPTDLSTVEYPVTQSPRRHALHLW